MTAVAPNVAIAQYSLNMRDADVRAFVADAARVMHMTMIVDGRVNGKISVVTERPLSRSEYFEVFLSTLRANGLVAIPIQGGYRIQPINGAASEPTRITQRARGGNQFVTEIFRLKAIDAAGAIETLRPLVSSQGSVTANRDANSLVVVDFADNVARIRQLLERIDRDNATSQIVYLKNVGAREVAESLTNLAGKGANGSAPPVTVTAIDSSNALALRGDTTAVARFVAMAQGLDQHAADGTQIRVYWLEHADAEQLLPVLQQLLGQPVTQPSEAPGFITSSSGSAFGKSGSSSTAATSSPTPSPTPTSSGTSSGSGAGAGIATHGPAVVTRYQGANAIIVAANSDVQRKLGEVIRQLDTRREQVLVEAIIVEISDNAARKLGVQFLLGGKNTPFLATNYSNADPNILTLGGAAANYLLGRQTSTSSDGSTTTTYDNPLGSGITDAAAQSILNATGGFGGAVTEIGKNAVFGAILNAVKSDTESNVLSTPSIMTLDNQQAQLLVGQEIPVTTGEALSSNFDNAFRTVQRENVGIQLDVKPQINSSGSIKLYIRQEVSSISGPVSSNSSDLIVNKREFKTVLTVDDGDILAIGGLLDQNERRTLERIPLLSDIPLLGELFKSRSRSKVKTNLMVFIRPTIIRSAEDARKLTARRYGYIRGRQLARNPNEEPSIDALVRDYMGAAPPAATPQPGDVTYDGSAPPPAGPETDQ
ncbi:type II secretion system secretin GspD [Stakelama sediminis]|nr:type II secretion system secretin GspD [Stakelama sediminis]